MGIHMEIISFPVLTVAAIEEQGWEPALTLPLPVRPSFQVLDMASDRILSYLAWVVSDLAQTDPDQAVREIQRISTRLTEIAAATPTSLTAAMEADVKSFQADTGDDRNE